VLEKINQLEQKRHSLSLGGGQKRIEKHKEKGKMTARERILFLLDPDSFVELDLFMRHRCTDFGMESTETPGEGVVTGYGTVEGRLVYVSSQDFTVAGGSLGEAHAQKICKVMDMAVRNGAPIVTINDSGGARIQEGVDALNGYGNIFFRNTLSSGVIPQISVIMGPCAGGAVYSPALTDFVFMTKTHSQMFITGPQVIKAVTGEDVSMEDLGGASVHSTTSGVAHFMSATDEDCLLEVRRLLGFLPSNNMADAPLGSTSDLGNRSGERLLELIPPEANRSYDARELVTEVLDDGNFMEVQPYYAENMVVGFGRMNGRTVGIIANQPKVLAGSLDINASDKAARFIRFCDSFNIPLITFVDTPGYLPGVNQEYGGIIRHGAKLLYAYSEATVPKLTVLVRKAYGGAYLAMCSRALGADAVFAYPTAEVAVMGPEGAANILFKDDISGAAEPAKVRQEKIEEYRQKFANPYVAASRGMVDDIIDPRDTRRVLCNALEANATKRENRPKRKHGNMPL